MVLSGSRNGLFVGSEAAAVLTVLTMLFSQCRVSSRSQGGHHGAEAQVPCSGYPFRAAEACNSVRKRSPHSTCEAIAGAYRSVSSASHFPRSRSISPQRREPSPSTTLGVAHPIYLQFRSCGSDQILRGLY